MLLYFCNKKNRKSFTFYCFFTLTKCEEYFLIIRVWDMSMTSNNIYYSLFLLWSWPHLHRYWIVGVGRQILCRRTEASIGEHVLGGVIQDVWWRWRAGSDRRSRLLLQETVKILG